MKERTNKRAEELARLARERLDIYVPLVHRIQQGKKKGEAAYPEPHHLRMLAALADDGLGHTVIVAPPGSAKTTLVLAACEWWLGRDPALHIGYFANIYPQAEMRSLAVRETIERNPYYRAIFPDAKRGDGLWGGQAWTLSRPPGDKDPTFFAANPNTGLGWRFERIVLDDIADQENMASAPSRRRIREWLALTAMSRLTPGGRALMICTRWHEDDPAQWAINQGWHLVHIPAIEDGQSYWPEAYPVHELEQLYKNGGMTRLQFELMYQGRVIPDEGTRIRREWFQYYDELPVFQAVIQSWDTAYTASEEAAYSVGGTWGLGRGPDGRLGHFLIDLYRGRPLFPDLKRAIISHYERHRPLAILVEDRASGQSILQALREETRLPLIGIKVWKRSKESRVNAVDGMAPMIESGRVFLPSPAYCQRNRIYWVEDYLHEVCAVPNSQYWDQVDMTTQYFDWVRRRQLVRPEVTVRMAI